MSQNVSFESFWKWFIKVKRSEAGLCKHPGPMRHGRNGHNWKQIVDSLKTWTTAEQIATTWNCKRVSVTRTLAQSGEWGHAVDRIRARGSGPMRYRMKLASLGPT